MSQPWAELMQQALSAEVTPHRDAMRRVGEATRSVIDHVVATRAPEEALATVAEVLEAVARSLAHYPQGRLYEGFGETANAGDPHAFFDNSPIIGIANPLAPPIKLTIEGDVVAGQVTFGAAYEGPPGCVHGGYLAAAFDDVLGMVQATTGRPGMTGRLTVSYRQPTPLHVPLRYEGRVERIEGRKIFTRGECLNGDEVTCEAEGLFISVDFEQIAKLYDKRGR